MNKFEQLLDDYVRYNMRYCTDTDGFDKEGLQRIKNMLVERDKKLLEALKRIASGMDVDHSARIAVDVLKEIGEEY